MELTGRGGGYPVPKSGIEAPFTALCGFEMGIIAVIQSAAESRTPHLNRLC
jgi:hypothetical protein